MKELAVDYTMTEKIIKILQQQIDLAKDMNRRNITLSVEEAEILIDLMRDTSANNISDKIVRCSQCIHAGVDCEMAFCFGDRNDWFCGDGERR